MVFYNYIEVMILGDYMKEKYKRFLKNINIISEHYNYLVNLTKNSIFVGATNE